MAKKLVVGKLVVDWQVDDHDVNVARSGRGRLVVGKLVVGGCGQQSPRNWDLAPTHNL